MQCVGNFLTVSVFSFFWRQRKRKFKTWRYLRCLAICFWRPNKRQTSFRRLPLYIPFERLVCLAMLREKSRQNLQAKLRLPLFIMNEIEQPHVKRTNEKSTLKQISNQMP